MIASLWVAFGVLTALDLWSKARPHPRLERVVKPGAMVALLAIAVLSGALGSSVGIAFVVALVWCVLGDILLLGDSDPRFLGGLAAFLAGHVAYAVGFGLIGLTHPWWAGAGALLITGLLPIAARVVRGAARDGGSAMAGAVAAYITVISAMAIIGVATGHRWLALGAFVFVASDTILGFNRFVRPLPWGAVGVMATYLLAQALLVLGLLEILPG